MLSDRTTPHERPRADRLPAVETIGHVALVIAAAVWVAVFLALEFRIARALWATARGGRATLEG